MLPDGPTGTLFASAEIRWFFQGEMPPAVADWFRGFTPIAEAPRTDRYVYLPGITGTGIKWREGRFELKALRSSAPPRLVAPRLIGAMERWLKWSMPQGPDMPAVTADGSATGPKTVEVAKARHLVRLDVSADPLRAVEGVAFPAELVSLELVVLHVAGQRHWSLALEAASASGQETDNLKRGLGHLIRPAPPPFTFKAEHSSGYPAWLDRLQRDAAEAN